MDPLTPPGVTFLSTRDVARLHQWTGLYPGGADARARFDALGGEVTPDRLYQIIRRHVGETMTRIGGVELRPTAGPS